ncbi:hypothetical protein V5279_24505 [Bradyrhizobium sp. 26S5]|uniref:hypothetical protein n=1 Tax=Bradyrhizobium sp. 26S5 TaxID=3139729 RepID=UPI0030D547D5
MDVNHPLDTPPPGWRPNSEYADRVRKAMSPAALKSAVTWDELLDVLGIVIEGNAKVADRIAVLQQKIIELKERPPVPWEGPWDPQKQFTRHSFCSDRGAMWYAMADSKGVRPGSGEGVWRLCVKAGKDAR